MAKGFTHESTYNESKEWYTPDCIFQALGIEFDLDPASPGADIVSWIPVHDHYQIKHNGLQRNWHGNVWLNPPYGSDTPKWFRKLALHGQGIGLVFSRTDTVWFHEYVPMADAVCFIKGRVQFVPAGKEENGDFIDYPFLYAQGKYVPKGGCGAGSMLVAYGEENSKALFNCGLGLTLPVGKHLQMVESGNGSQVSGSKSITRGLLSSDAIENLPQNAENRQGTLFRS